MCFAMEYMRVSGDAEPDLFPRRVTLLPGADSGEVLSEPSRGDTLGFWRMFAIPGTAHWRQVRADSVELTFTNGFTSVAMGLASDSAGVRGGATIHYDVVSDEPPPRVAAVGSPTACPNTGPPAA